MYNKIAETTGVSKTDVEAIIKALSDELLEVIAANDSFKLGEVVTIKGIEKPARTCGNPRTGEVLRSSHIGCPLPVLSVGKEILCRLDKPVVRLHLLGNSQHDMDRHDISCPCSPFRTW